MTIRFAAAGLSHNHIYGQVDMLLEAGAELTAFWGLEPENIAEFTARYPQARQVSDVDEILNDEQIHLIASAAVPDQRAPLGIAAMQHGKDYLSDKPSFVSFAQLSEARRVQSETGRIYNIYFSEHLANKATVKAQELVEAGAIGRLIQTIGFGPHRLFGHTKRPPWTFAKKYFGGVINDLASHQLFQFLALTNSTSAEIVTSQIGNFKFRQYAEFEDFGDLVVRSPVATGYVRVDWLTPDGLGTWGDVRLFLLGTEGYIELRKNADIAGRPDGNHLFLVDHKGTHYIDCADTRLPFGGRFINDILNRTETAVSQERCFLASELALRAQEQATVLTVASTAAGGKV